MIDETTDLGALVARHLREDRVAWLTTVTPGDPPRTRNIAHNPKVSINFAGDGAGGDIVILSGRAQLEASGRADQLAPYVEKYGWGFDRLRITPEQFAQRYSAPIRIRLTKVRGHK
jgi:hypothetical protein